MAASGACCCRSAAAGSSGRAGAVVEPPTAAVAAVERFVRQHFAQPWVLEGLRRGPVRTASGLADGSWRRPMRRWRASPCRLRQVATTHPTIWCKPAIAAFLPPSAVAWLTPPTRCGLRALEAPDVQHIARQRTVCAAQRHLGTSMMYPDGKCLPDSRARCTERYGTWKRVGWTQELLCVEPTPDGGRSCTDGAQCAARICLHDGPENTRPNGKWVPTPMAPRWVVLPRSRTACCSPLCVD